MTGVPGLRWTSLLARAACLAAAAWLAGCGTAAAPAPVAEVDRALFVLSGDARPPPQDARWEPITLPDPWDARRRGVYGSGWYRLEVEAAAHADLGVYLTRTLSNAQLWANGHLAGQLGDFAGRPPDRWSAHPLFAVPRELVREGRNVLEIRIVVPHDKYGGIGTVLVGDHDALHAIALRDQFARAIAPAVASLAMVLLGGFILVLWVRRAEDHLYAYFAAGTILWGLHTGVSLLPQVPLPPPHYEIWWNVVYVLFVALLCIFSVRFAGARWPRYERACLLWVAASVPALYAAAAWQAHPALAQAVRLGGIAMALAALVAIVRHTLRTREVAGWILLAAGGVAAAFGVRDWVAALDPANMGAIEWVPYVALIFALLMGWIMVDRFVKTLNQYERLNVELEERVAEKSRALAVELRGQEEARREAETANLAKSRFLAAASHDLRQPLHALGLFGEALDRRTHDPESRELVQRINQSIAALESLFNEVLDVSKLDAGAVTPAPRAIAVDPVFRRIASDFVPEALAKGLALRVVPTAAAVVSDPVLLERILRNLVANAIRYTRSGGVVVGVRRRGAGLAIEVRDSGVGIDPAEQPRVFEEFYQVGNPERDRRMGLGLGLAIVKRLCELLGHPLALRSAPGRGTTFTILLPRAAVPAALPAESVAAGPLAGTRVLVLDDEAEVLDSTATLLRSWGCAVEPAATLDEALARLRAAPRPDLLIVDYRLRAGANGLDAARALRAEAAADIPVIVVSGESSAEELARIQASGFVLLHKPAPPAKLRGIMAHLLGPRGA